jgi:hypothetical protein
LEIMIPAPRVAAAPEMTASTLKSLKGVSVALVDDNFDMDFTEEVEKLLRDEYGAEVTRLLKPWASHPSPKELIEQAAQCQVAVVGIAL